MRVYLGIRRWFLGRWMWSFDLLVGLLVCTGTSFAIRHFASEPFCDLINSDGTTIYGAILSTSGALLGFIIAAITIVQGLVSSKTFAGLRQGIHYESFWLAFVWSIKSLGLAAIVALTAMFLGHFADLWVYICMAVVVSTVTAIFGLGRAVRTLEVLLKSYRDIQKQVDESRVTVVKEFPAVNPED